MDYVRKECDNETSDAFRKSADAYEVNVCSDRLGALWMAVGVRVTVQ